MQTVIKRISHMGNIVSMVTVMAMMVLTVLDVILRKLGGAVMGAVEISELMLVVVAFFSFPYCLVLGRHIEIDVLTGRLSSRGKSASMAFGVLIGLVFFGAMMLGSVKFTIDAVEVAEISPILKIPLFPVKLLLMIGCFIFCLQLIASLVHHLRQMVEGG